MASFRFWRKREISELKAGNESKAIPEKNKVGINAMIIRWLLEVRLVILPYIFVARQSGKYICVSLCERTRVCACFLRKEMPVCGAHPLSASSLAVITWGGWGIIVVAGWLFLHSSLWESRKWLLYSRHVTALMVTASLWLLCPFLSPSTKSWLCLPLHLTRRFQWVRSIAASVNISLHIWSNTFLLL